jgi:lipopolysaccharide/colanic/teichoic acid biosynthesis glycosyltransferase
MKYQNSICPLRHTACAKRLYDIFFSFIGLALLSPLFALIAALIKVSGRGPVLYRQWRVGLSGRPFRVCKFRSMHPQADGTGPLVTSHGDARVTRIGRVLRRSKLDELPQLWNVLKGDMSLVGPRPEVPRYVERYTREQRAILNFKPGITDPAAILFRDEEVLLKDASDLEDNYVRHFIPRKIELSLEYAARANLASDTGVILRTLFPACLSVRALKHGSMKAFEERCAPTLPRSDEMEGIV